MERTPAATPASNAGSKLSVGAWRARCGTYNPATRTCHDAQVFIPAASGADCPTTGGDLFQSGWWAVGGENSPDAIEGCHFFCMLTTGTSATESVSDWTEKEDGAKLFSVNRRLRGYSTAETYGNVCNTISAPVFGATGSAVGLRSIDIVKRFSKEYAPAHLALTISFGTDTPSQQLGFTCQCEF